MVQRARASPAPPAPADAHTASGTLVKAPIADSAALVWKDALSQCLETGGHLPRVAELVHLIQSGLPNGSGAILHTADHYTRERVAGVRWTGARNDFGYGLDIQDVMKGSPPQTLERPYRCIYYPLATDFTKPDEAKACFGGCARFDLLGGAQIWIDRQDRSSASLPPAIADCASSGGRLARLRDYQELIPKGLENGSDTYLLTAEVAQNGSENFTLFQTKWTGIDPGFDPSVIGTMRSSGKDGPAPYRCLWTNEVR